MYDSEKKWRDKRGLGVAMSIQNPPKNSDEFKKAIQEKTISGNERKDR